MKTLDLSQRLAQQIEQKNTETLELANAELMAFSSNLKDKYTNELNTISAHIRDHNQQIDRNLSESLEQSQSKAESLRTALTLMWIKPLIATVIILLTIGVSTWGLMQYMTIKIKNQIIEIEQNNKILDQMKVLKISRCDQRPCVQIDPSMPEYENNYRIVKLK